MAILRELVAKAAAVTACAIARGSATKSCALERTAAAKACALERTAAAKACALERTAAAKACAKERVSSAGVTARLAMQLARNRFDIWMLRRAQARQRRISNRRTYKKECELKRLDYELKLEEYEEWRMIQFEIKLRDIFKRMQKLGQIDPAREFPIPLRPDLYNYRPSPLPPAKSYAEHLQHVGEVVGLFDKTVKIVLVSPVVTIGTVVCCAALAVELYEEVQRPGTFKNHVHQLSSIFRGFMLESLKEDPSKAKEEASEGKHDKAKEEASEGKHDKAKEEASPPN